ncbi:MAG: hypothetical protein H0W04_03575 [Chthoniobacterales bacterium]|nr:hypothetical protein [Chthoniobacterales bacterium]
MRIVLGLLLVLAAAGGFLTQKKSEQPAPAQNASSTNKVAAAPRETSEHNWAKRSLDQAAGVKRQVAQQQKENGQE